LNARRRGLPAVEMQPLRWAKVTIGVLLIGGILTGLWATNRPSVNATVDVTPTPTPVALHDARAALVVLVVHRGGSGSARTRRARIACDGARRSASGFWARDPRGACDALAATRGALLSGRGCPRTPAGRPTLRAVGAFGNERFDHRAVRGGCTPPDDWLSVNVLAAPVVRPDSELERRSG
jgi:hypothetical protein